MNDTSYIQHVIVFYYIIKFRTAFLCVSVLPRFLSLFTLKSPPNYKRFIFLFINRSIVFKKLKSSVFGPYTFISIIALLPTCMVRDKHCTRPSIMSVYSNMSMDPFKHMPIPLLLELFPLRKIFAPHSFSNL